jgi:hypothetical protein
MLIFALLAAGFGSSTQTEAKEQERSLMPREVAVEQELVPPPTGNKPKHFFEKRFEKSPDKRSFMVITPAPHTNQFSERQEGSQWLEPPEGWVSPELKTKPYRVKPAKEPAPKLRILRGGER